MIANHIRFHNGYWYLNATLHCDMQDYRRPGSGNVDDWEQLEYNGTWEPELLADYCEELLQAYIKNNGVVTQVFVKD